MPGHINGNKVNIVVDIGSNTTILSRGAARLLKLKVESPRNASTFQGVSGNQEAYEGYVKDLTFTLHPRFEFDVDQVRVSSNDGFLILLGNDLLTTNACYKFRSLTKNEFVGELAF